MSASAAATASLALGLGIGVSLVCRQLRIPAVLPLMITGIACGRAGLGIIDAQPLGDGLRAFISVAIGLLICSNLPHDSQIRAAVVAFSAISVPMNMIFGFVLGRMTKRAERRKLQPRPT